MKSYLNISKIYKRTSNKKNHQRIQITNPKPKKNQSLREKSDKKSGGQKGREGVTLKQSDTPDEIIPLSYTLSFSLVNSKFREI